MALENVDHAIAALRMNALLIEDDLCINARAHNILCRRCEEICEPKAITVATDSIDLTDDACTGCGGCVPVCPAGALRLTVFDASHFVAAIAHRAVVHVHCAESRDEGGGVVIPCHRLIDGRLMAAAMARGATELVLHARPSCAGCHRGSAAKSIAQAQSTMQRWFGDKALKLRAALPGESAGPDRAERHDQVHASRRNFLRLAGTRGMASAAWLIPLPAADELGHEQREVLLPGEFRKKRVPHLAVLAECAETLPWSEGALLPWVARSFTDDCSGCGVCARCCPTGALMAFAKAERTGIAFAVGCCANCGLCVAICPERAIEAKPLRDVAAVSAPPVTLVIKRVVRCPQCSQDHVAETGDEICPQCRNEQAIDEDWLAMLEG